MTITVGKYTFSAWLRKGIGSAIEQTDNLGTGPSPTTERATVPVDVLVNASAVHKDFTLLGPGDVIGINPDAVVRTEPPTGVLVTDYEPNYLPFIEFYDEDLLWRYTPARAAGDRLRPWLALLVLEEATADAPGEFTRSQRTNPLASIVVRSTASLPPHTQTWAWAHVHTNEDFAAATDFELFLESLEVTDHPNADRIICRLMCPRHLKADTAYSAFVVPAFETGRRAGLAMDPAGVDAQQPAWTDAAGSVELPIYYEWRLRTGEQEDFESMAKRLVPWPADPRLGIRLMDGEKPGWGLTAGTDIGAILPADEKQSAIGLEGAIKAPTAVPRPVAIDSTRPFLQQLQSVLNLPQERQAVPATGDLPVVEPPIYARYHALRDTVDVTRADWLDALNRDPRNRVSAGFGVQVVRENQEGYVARAWDQVRQVLAANRVIRLAAFAMRASDAVYQNLAAGLDGARTVSFFSPVLRKVRGSPTTLQALASDSTLPPAVLSAAMRRLLRPRGPLVRRIAAADAAFSHASLVTRLADGPSKPGGLAAAPPKQPGSDLLTDTGVVAALPPGAGAGLLPAWVTWLFRHRGRLLALVLLVLLVLILATGAVLPLLLLAALVVAAFFAFQAWVLGHGGAGSSAGSALTTPTAVADAVRDAPPRDGFGLIERDPVVVPMAAGATQVTTTVDRTSTSPGAVLFNEFASLTPVAAGADTVEAAMFRTAAIALEQRLAISLLPVPVRPSFDLVNAKAKLTAAVLPLKAFPRRVAAGVRFIFDPAWLQQAEHLVPAMAYPDFDDPMYEKLRDISSELLLPNLEVIPPNSITLLETNPPFIEAYLAGLNHEFGKELLWREYPTDRRGSYFRQFWDVRGILAEQTGESPASISERSKDIIPLDQWPPSSALGTHRNPKRPPGEQLVLTIRGDLLKKYPNTLVYAQKAHLARDSAGRPTPDADPVIAPVASEADVAREIRFPVFKASVDPDIRFVGFDLSIEQARGDANPRLDTDDWGWYFIIQQLPGEPRFGMDVTFAPDGTPLTWNDLAWTQFPDTQAFIDTTVRPQAFVPGGPGESLAQWGTDSARMASILFQTPAMIAVHAKEMLENLS